MIAPIRRLLALGGIAFLAFSQCNHVRAESGELRVTWEDGVAASYARILVLPEGCPAPDRPADVRPLAKSKKGGSDAFVLIADANGVLPANERVSEATRFYPACELSYFENVQVERNLPRLNMVLSVAGVKTLIMPSQVHRVRVTFEEKTSIETFVIIMRDMRSPRQEHPWRGSPRRYECPAPTSAVDINIPMAFKSPDWIMAERDRKESVVWFDRILIIATLIDDDSGAELGCEYSADGEDVRCANSQLKLGVQGLQVPWGGGKI